MNYPKKKLQDLYMGKKCIFDGEYYRDYGKEKSSYGQEFGHTRKTPVKWKVQTHKPQTGWIVGFGFCFDGVIEAEVGIGEDYKHFISSKRVNYVRVRKTPSSQELKIPAKNIRFESI